jgi:hypothetical protein
MVGKATVVLDPAGAQQGQANEMTPYQVLAKYFNVVYAGSDKLPPRLNAAEMWFAGQVDGKPRIVFDPRSAHLQRALAHNYRFVKKKDTGVGVDTRDIPDKNHASNIADAFMYLCMYAGGGQMGVAQQRARSVAVASARGWT